MSGSGGSPADAGDAGDAAPVPNLCKLKCDSSDDCTSNANDVGMTCSVLGSCLGCSTDTSCVQILSEWLLPCTGDVDCIPMGPTYVCIEAYGTGRCAKPAPLNPAEPCAPPDPPNRVARPRVGNSGTIDVCAHNSAKCDSVAGACYLSCPDDEFCTKYLPHTSKCNVQSGRCECTGVMDCIGSTLGPVCRNGHCGCDQDNDCSGDAGVNGSVCVANTCSCTSLSDCKVGKKDLDGVYWVCEPADPVGK